jgi:ABC-2 type transport system permease protein
VRLVTEAVKVWAFTGRGVIMNRRNVFAVFEMLFWPLVGLFSVGLLTRFLALGPETVSFVLIGAVAMNTVQIAQLDVSYALLYDVWGKSLKHGFMAPINLGHVVLGSGLVGLIRGAVVFSLMLGCSVWAFGMDLGHPGWPVLLVFFIGLFLVALIEGVVVLSLVLFFGHRAEITAWAISYLVLLLSGMYYPVTMLPTGLQTVAQAFPLTYFLEYFRDFYGFPLSAHGPLWWGFGLSLGYLLAGYGLVTFSLRWARKRGTLLKLSE